MMRIKPTVEGFLAYVKAQPRDRTISHKDCISCAIGDYVYQMQSKPVIDRFGIGGQFTYMTSTAVMFLLSFEYDEEDLHALLDGAYSGEGLDTYGELQHVLDSYPAREAIFERRNNV